MSEVEIGNKNEIKCAYGTFHIFFFSAKLIQFRMRGKNFPIFTNGFYHKLMLTDHLPPLFIQASYGDAKITKFLITML